MSLLPARAPPGEAGSLHLASPKQPVVAASRRSATEQGPPRPSEVRTSAPPASAAGSRPGPRASLGGGSAGARRAGVRDKQGGACGPPSAPGTWALAGAAAGPLSFQTPGLPRLRPQLPATAAAPRRSKEPRRAPVARPAGARGRGGAQGRARAPLSPTDRPRPQCAAAARWRLSPRALWLTVVSLAKLRCCVEGGCRAVLRPSAADAPSGRRAGRPSQQPRFFTCREFSRARSSIARFSPLALVFFLSFLLLVPQHGRFFRSRRLRSPARALLPAGLGGAGRPAALPAPLHPRSGGGGGSGAPRSDSFQYGTGAGRMRPHSPPPQSALLPAARAPRAARAAPPSPASPKAPVSRFAQQGPRGMWRPPRTQVLGVQRSQPTPPVCHQPTTCGGHPQGRGAGHTAMPPVPDSAAAPRGPASTRRRYPRDPAPTLTLPKPTREGLPRLTSGLWTKLRNPSGVPGWVLASGLGRIVRT